MYKLIKTINKFNGNICFASNTENGDYIFEGNCQSKSLSYVPSTKKIIDICSLSSNAYSIAFSDQYIGKYDGTLYDSFLDTGISNVDKILMDTQNNYYILNKTLNQLVKFNVSALWTFDLPDYDLRNDGNMAIRESSGTIIYHNNENIHIIRDDITAATLLNSLGIEGSGDLRLLISNEFNPSYSYVRARTVSNGDLGTSSSSSNSSSFDDQLIVSNAPEEYSVNGVYTWEWYEIPPYGAYRSGDNYIIDGRLYPSFGWNVWWQCTGDLCPVGTYNPNPITTSGHPIVNWY